MKRMFSLLLSMLLLLACLALPASAEEPIRLTVYSQLANWNGEMTGWFAKIMLEKFNVVLSIVPDEDGVYETRMESGNLGDIVIWGADGEEYLNAVEFGMLFDWEDEDLVSEYGPYIQENMQAALEKNRNLSGGNVYGFGHNVAPSSDEHEAFFYTWDIRWDLYKQLGYPEVKDLDGLLELFEAMKAICPTDENGNETYALSLWPDWDGTMVMYVKSLATAYYGYDELEMGLYDPDTGTFYAALDPNGPYLEMVKFLNTIFRKGLLDPNSMTQTFEQMAEKVLNGGTFFSIFDYAGSMRYNTPEHQAQNRMMMSLVPTDARPICYGMNVQGGNRIWTIGAKSMYPETCMEIINYLCTPEGRLTMDYGPKGLCWDYDENGKTYFTPLGKLCKENRNTDLAEQTGGEWIGRFGDGSMQMNNTTWTLSAINPESGERYNSEYWASNQMAAQSQIEQDWRDFTGFNYKQDYLDSKPYKVALGTSYTSSSRQDEFKLVWEQVKNCIVDGTWNAIYAKSDGEFNYLINAMVTRAKGYGYEQCVAWSENEAAIRHALEEAVRGK